MWLRRVWIIFVVALLVVEVSYSQSSSGDILVDSSFALLVPQSDSNGNGINCVKDDVYLEYFERVGVPPRGCNLPYFFSDILPTFFLVREKRTDQVLFASDGLMKFLNDAQVIIDPNTASVTSVLSSFQPIVFACNVDIDRDGNIGENPDDLIQIPRIQGMNLGVIGQFFDRLKNPDELGLQTQRIDFYGGPYYEEPFAPTCQNFGIMVPRSDDPKIEIINRQPQIVRRDLSGKDILDNTQEVEIGGLSLKLPIYAVEKSRSSDGIFTFEISLNIISNTNQDSKIRFLRYVQDPNNPSSYMYLDPNNGFLPGGAPENNYKVVLDLNNQVLDLGSNLDPNNAEILPGSTPQNIKLNIRVDFRKNPTIDCNPCTNADLFSNVTLVDIVMPSSAKAQAVAQGSFVSSISELRDPNDLNRLFSGQDNNPDCSGRGNRCYLTKALFNEELKIVPIYLINSRQVNEINLYAESSRDSEFVVKNSKNEYYIRGTMFENLINEIGQLELTPLTFGNIVQDSKFYLACRGGGDAQILAVGNPTQIELRELGSCRLFLDARFIDSNSPASIPAQVIPIGDEFSITDFDEDNGKDITEEILTATALHSKVPFYGPEDINVCGKNEDGKVVNVFDKCSLGGDEGQCGDLELCECRENNIVRGKFQCRVKEKLETPNYCLLIGNTKEEEENRFNPVELVVDGSEKCGVANNIFFYRLPNQKISQNLWYTISFIDREWSIERIRRSFGALYLGLRDFFTGKVDKLPDDMVLICRSEDTCANKK